MKPLMHPELVQPDAVPTRESVRSILINGNNHEKTIVERLFESKTIQDNPMDERTQLEGSRKQRNHLLVALILGITLGVIVVKTI